MASEEKSAWIAALVSAGAYSVYLIIILGRAENTALAEVSYVSTMLWIIGASIGALIAAHIVVSIVVSIAAPEDADKKDQCDKEIRRFGDYIGQIFVGVGAMAALGMAMAELNHFWIANVIYFGFALSTLVGSATKFAAYRWGFQRW